MLKWDELSNMMLVGANGRQWTMSDALREITGRMVMQTETAEEASAAVFDGPEYGADE